MRKTIPSAMLSMSIPLASIIEQEPDIQELSNWARGGQDQQIEDAIDFAIRKHGVKKSKQPFARTLLRAALDKYITTKE